MCGAVVGNTKPIIYFFVSVIVGLFVWWVWCRSILRLQPLFIVITKDDRMRFLIVGLLVELLKNAPHNGMVKLIINLI